ERESPERCSGKGDRPEIPGSDPAAAGRAPGERREDERRENGQGRIDRVEVTHRFGERAGVIRDEQRGVQEKGQQQPLSFPKDRNRRPDQSRERGQAEKRAAAPDDEVVQREERSAASPLQSRGETGHARGKRREPLQVFDVARVQPERERARPQEGVRKSHANGQRRDDGEEEKTSCPLGQPFEPARGRSRKSPDEYRR